MKNKKIVVLLKYFKGELNPFDGAALECTIESGAKEIIALSMAPRYALNAFQSLTRLGVKGVFISDPLYAGSDTQATSLVLEKAIKRIKPDLIFCGRQSVDGDTAQVPPMLAQRLGFAIKTKAIAFEKEGITLRNGERLVPQEKTVITFEKIRTLRFPSIFSKLGQVEIWDNSVLQIPEEKCGLKGSPTRVVKSYESSVGRRDCQFVGIERLDELIQEGLKKQRIEKAQTAEEKLKACYFVGNIKQVAEGIAESAIELETDEKSAEEIAEEIKAKKTVDKLTLMTAPTAMVIRDGIKLTIPVTDIVLDDIVYLELGKQVCADCVVVKGECEANESMLTGESVPVKKKLGEALYSGSFVSSGNCFARVVRVGDANYVARLASKAKKHKKPKSELRNSIAAIIKGVSVIIIPVAIFMTILGLAKMDLNTTVQQTARAIIGMIPSGMFLLTSIALAVSVIKLGKRNTMVKDLYCIEMLARVDTLCLDKTGTITDGTMAVTEYRILDGTSDESFQAIMAAIEGSERSINNTSAALIDRFGKDVSHNVLKKVPFSSKRKDTHPF